ncbi:MAG: ferritin-like domain-containing protein [Acidobacteria bacterium]|nr:ferritin-like domain-containing protein [Acidobacteriota bacterium]MCA1609912.1 ferritin-like domain-containing protein [Acidobacteriota bacterium]
MPLEIGSEEHRRLYCRTFIETHKPYRPEDLAWPDLDAEGLARLKSLPVWNEAVRTEAATAVKVQALGRAERDPVLAEAISLQGYEEGRHASVIALLTRHYGIETDPFPPPEEPANPTWTFLRTGYGECLDSFFAFGLFDVGRRTDLFAAELIGLFDQIMQEEARHILFLVNWAADLRARRPLLARPAFDLRRAWNIGAQAFDRVRGAMAMKGSGNQTGFTMQTHGLVDLSPRSFLELCLSENDRRLSPYDPRLLRPSLTPAAVRAVLRVLPKKRSEQAFGSTTS